MTQGDENILKKIASIFPYKTCVDLIQNDSTFRKEFEDWYLKKYGRTYDWKQGIQYKQGG